MVEAFADWTDCNEVIQTEGRMLSKADRFGVVTHYANPVVAMASDAQKRFLAFAIQFGLTPASRAKVTAAIVKQEHNPFEDIETDT
jgi:P27 family predicted phage terminase small subunit